MVLTWSQAAKPMELKPEESSVMICWMMTVDRIAASAVGHVLYRFVTFPNWLGATFVKPIPAHNHVNIIHISMLTILDFESWAHIHITHRLVMSSVPNGVNPLIAQHGQGLLLVLKMRMSFAFIFTVRRNQDLLDWTPERILNWHFWFSWLVGVTTPPAHSPAYVQIVEQNWVKKLMDVTPCHLPFLWIFLLARGVVTL